MIKNPDTKFYPPADDEYKIMGIYNFSCVVHPYRRAVCLHEEPPKSLNPGWRLLPQARYAVCNECHMLVHQIPRKDAAYMLEQARSKNFPHAVEELEEYARQLQRQG